MPTLRELQSMVFDSIALRPGEHDYCTELIRSVAPKRGVDPSARIDVYADAYWLRLLDVLKGDFPVLERELGQERFASLAREYLAAHPSTEPSVRSVGRAFADFTERRGDLPDYCSALARLEWVMADVFDASDSTPIDIGELREIAVEDWADLRFVPIPALSILVEEWPIQRLWNGENASSLVPVKTSICVWRDRNYEVRHAELDAFEARAMKLMIAGKTFSTICKAYDGLTSDESAREASLALGRWLARGIIATFSINPDRAP